MFITVLFTIMTGLLIVLQKRRENNWVNLISILTAPYLILVFLNNFFVYKTGFYKINDNVLIMLLVSFYLFYLGGLPFNVRRSFLEQEDDNIEKFKHYNMKWMTRFLYFVGIVGLLKVLLLYQSGQFNASNIDSSEGLMGNGMVGHLILASYAVLPIVFLYWIYNKKIKYILPVIMIMIVTFSSLVKYNIVGMFVTMFIFLLIYKKTLLRKAVIVLVGAVVAIFISNYALTFAIKGAKVSSNFYLGHLWTYMSGSLIYDNYIFTSGIRTDISIIYKIMTFICALPNMFINKLFGTTLFPHTRQNTLWTSSFGETSNVVDAFGYMFPSKGDIMDLFAFAIVIVCVGFFFTGIYQRNIRRSRKFNTFIANFLCYFVFFSFFGTFYINSSPWEILAYSIVIPILFYRRKAKSNGTSWNNDISRII